MDMAKPDMTKMRRADRAISREDALAVIDRCAYGTLSLIATDGTPYAVALNVVRDGEKLFFHSAMAGLKVDSLRENPQGLPAVCGKPDDLRKRADDALYLHCGARQSDRNNRFR